ncbi:hypothetical protein AJ88_25105 [Mesorhizobium amorphae CCBAU 01583]|nr:hypothetical protein AJ88_25105 [Mesorhizobium amorphae CCBAU 01583]
MLRHGKGLLPQHVGDRSIVQSHFCEDRRDGMPETLNVRPSATASLSKSFWRSFCHDELNPAVVHGSP